MGRITESWSPLSEINEDWSRLSEFTKTVIVIQLLIDAAEQNIVQCLNRNRYVAQVVARIMPDRKPARVGLLLIGLIGIILLVAIGELVDMNPIFNNPGLSVTIGIILGISITLLAFALRGRK